MNAHETPDGNLCLTGTKDALDAATLWLRAIFHSALGAEQGEEAASRVPAIVALLAFKQAVEEAPEC